MWSEQEFGESQRGLLHGRSRKSLAKASFMLYKQAGKSFSAILGNSFRQDIAAIFAKEEMVASTLLKGHVQATVERAKAACSQRIIVAQDTTYFNYSSHKTKQGLTPIQGQVKGLVQHNVLAMNEHGLPLGLLWQHTWARKGKNADLFKKESAKWFHGLQAVTTLAPAMGKKVVLVQDRESDILAFFKAPRAESVELIVRICQNRKLAAVDSAAIFPLAQASEQLVAVGTTHVWIMRQNRPVRLTLQVKAGQVRIHPGNNQSIARHQTPPMTLVSAQEIAATDEKERDCYQPKEAAHWLLLTTLTLAPDCTAFDIVTYYSLRWRIERFHYVQKSGALQVENLLFDDVHTLINALAFYSITAWRLVYITYLVRHDPQADAATCFDSTEQKLLSYYAGSPVTTITQAVKALGKLVGFQPSKKFPFPGVKKLGQALTRLHDMVQGFKLLEN